MTLIIGVRCGDGIVIGSDSATTYSSPDGQRTIEQDTVTKIRVIDKGALYASSGAVGLIQDVHSSLDSSWKNITKKAKHNSIKKNIADKISGQIKLYAQRMEDTLVVANREQQFVTKVGIESLIAVPIGNQFHLLRYDEHGNPEEYTSEMPIVTAGSGQVQADPFLAFVKRVAWKDQQPATVKQGIVGVLWTLQYVMARNAGLGVGGQPSVGILERVDDVWQASVLVGDRLSFYDDAIEGAEKSLYEHLNKPQSSRIPLPDAD